MARPRHCQRWTFTALTNSNAPAASSPLVGLPKPQAEQLKLPFHYTDPLAVPQRPVGSNHCLLCVISMAKSKDHHHDFCHILRYSNQGLPWSYLVGVRTLAANSKIWWQQSGLVERYARAHSSLIMHSIVPLLHPVEFSGVVGLIYTTSTDTLYARARLLRLQSYLSFLREQSRTKGGDNDGKAQY
jgi:hypothetical protein